MLADGERFGGVYQAVLANPPYIPAAELPSLMREVRREPRMALDGGDGLVFYRVIARVWAPSSAPAASRRGGGGRAGAAVAALFEEVGLTGLEILEDLGGIQRVVVGWRK